MASDLKTVEMDVDEPKTAVMPFTWRSDDSNWFAVRPVVDPYWQHVLDWAFSTAPKLRTCLVHAPRRLGKSTLVRQLTAAQLLNPRATRIALVVLNGANAAHMANELSK